MQMRNKLISVGNDAELWEGGAHGGQKPSAVASQKQRSGQSSLDLRLHLHPTYRGGVWVRGAGRQWRLEHPTSFKGFSLGPQKSQDFTTHHWAFRPRRQSCKPTRSRPVLAEGEGRALAAATQSS